MRFEQDILGIAMKGAFDVVDFHLFDWTTGSLIAVSLCVQQLITVIIHCIFAELVKPLQPGS